MTPEQKQRIDSMDYYALLTLWRFASTGDPIFQGEAGEYYAKVIAQKRNALPEGEASEISKAIGWRR